jgi:hypothetical protein
MGREIHHLESAVILGDMLQARGDFKFASGNCMVMKDKLFLITPTAIYARLVVLTEIGSPTWTFASPCFRFHRLGCCASVKLLLIVAFGALGGIPPLYAQRL